MKTMDKEHLTASDTPAKRRLADKFRRLRQDLSEKGFGYVIRRKIRKILKKTAGFMSRHTSGRAKTFFASAQKRGYRFALRTIYVKLYQKTGGRKPLVSFVLPVYNVEKYLPQCLDSLLVQTMPHIEIICVDDGSTDCSLKILKEYAEKDRRIKVFSQKNQFTGAARNLGLRKASGEYVTFLDSDDFFAKELAQAAYHAAKVNKADAVIFGGKKFENSTKQYRDAPHFCRTKIAPKIQPFSWRDCPGRFFQITTPAPWTKMFRRKFILDTKLQFQTLRNTNDRFFVYSALAMASRIVIVDHPLVYYRVGMSTNLQATKKKDPLCFYEAYKALHDKLAELGILDELRQSYVNVTLGGCVYNLDTVQDVDAKQQICNKLRNGGFEELELLGYDSKYYYDQDRYRQMMEIMDISATDDDSMHTQ